MRTRNNTIEVIRGDSLTLEVVFTDKETGLPIDITDCTVFFTVKDHLDDPDSDALISKTITSFVDPTSGVVDIEIEQDETTPAGQYEYDIQLRYDDDSIVSTRRGEFIICQDVTIRIS